MRKIKDYYYECHSEGLYDSCWRKDGKKQTKLCFINDYISSVRIKSSNCMIVYVKNNNSVYTRMLNERN